MHRFRCKDYRELKTNHDNALFNEFRGNDIGKEAREIRDRRVSEE